MNERIRKILEFARGDILNIGCVGSHPKDSKYWLHGLLSQKFKNVVGIDINVKEIKHFEKDYKCYVANAENFELDMKFDTIVAGELIEHLSNPGLFLNQAKKHLKENGILIITTPYPFSLINFIYALLKFPNTCSNPEHTCWFCPKTLQELARRYNYNVVYMDLVEDYYDNVPSLLYKIFVKIIKPFLPKRLKNNCIFLVLKPIAAFHPRRS